MDELCGLVKEFPQFVMSVPRTTWCDFYMYLPAGFVKNHKNDIPDNVLFHSPNGDIFEAKFNRFCGCFVGLSKLFNRYALQSSYWILFRYLGSSNFSIKIINCASIEIEYPFPAEYHTIPKLIPGVILIQEPEFEGSYANLIDDVNSSMRAITCCGRRYDQLEIHIDRSSLNEPEAVVFPSIKDHLTADLMFGQFIRLQFKERGWRVLLEKAPAHLLLTKGWLLFVTDVGLEVGDVCLLQRHLQTNIFLVGIHKDFGNTIRRLRQVNDMPQHFVKAVHDATWDHGELSIPLLFTELYNHMIPQELILIDADGVTFKCGYDIARCVIHGLQDFLRDKPLSAINLVVFHYSGNGVFLTSMLYKKDVDTFIAAEM